LWRGAEAERGRAVERVAPGIKDDIEDHYIMYPGPNSNSFGERVLKACGLHASLPATAIGKTGTCCTAASRLKAPASR
jgi:hypothetical protein